LPETLFIPNGQFNSILPAEAERQGIAVGLDPLGE